MKLRIALILVIVILTAAAIDQAAFAKGGEDDTQAEDSSRNNSSSRNESQNEVRREPENQGQESEQRGQEVENRGTEIENRQEIEIRGSNERIEADFPLFVDDNGKLFVQTANNRKEIRILPDQAAEIARSRGIIQRGTIKLEVADDNSASYKIVGEKKVRLFGLIPISHNIEAEVETENGEIQLHGQPWWSFLAI